MVLPVPNTLITTYLQLYLQDAKPIPPQPDNTHVLHMIKIDVSFYRFLYKAVGEKWRWLNRAIIDDETLAHRLSSASIFTLYADGVPAGYIELEQQNQDCEIVYFGLREAFHGRGLGKFLLLYGIQKALSFPDVARVWLHTCNLDGENAFPTYQKAGFSIYDQIQEPMPILYQD